MRRTVLITGCTDGSVGHALAKEFQARGLHVFATSRKISSMSGLANIPNLTLLPLDVTSPTSILAAVDSVQKHLGPGASLDLLVNNAGVGATAPAIDQNINDVKQIFETNVFGMMRMTQEFMPLLSSSHDACVANIGSVMGFFPVAFGSAYNASKAAVHSYSDTLRIELGPLNIKVVTVVLGGVKSNINTYPTKPLPSESPYVSIEHIFTRVRGESGDNTMPAEEFARRFATEVLKASPPSRLTVGTGARKWSFLTAILPRSLLEHEIGKALGLDQLSGLLEAASKSK